MLIKSADDQSAFIAQLEHTANGQGPEAKRAAEELRIRKAGLKGESESAYLIDFDFASGRNWAVLHDLRLERNGRVAQVDHVLINRMLEVYVLESKHFRDGLKITDDGEFLRWNGYKKTFEGMPSPLAQNDRHISVLRDVMADLDLPVRMGLTLSPSFVNMVLVAPSARVDRPKRFDTSRVIKADQLKAFIEKDLDSGALLRLAKVVSSETLEQLARQLAAQHVPMQRQAPTVAPPVASNKVASDPVEQIAGPACKACNAAKGEILHGRFGYYFKCDACETNTSIKFECAPGHAPRLRKEKLEFFRECAECGTSALFHRNTQ
ncbi:NERD domain protein [Lysobacter dokdonensis DS-58]|uniref:NERD domain protein n=1 Tax=Lysobacter dokdonensis DS-58 TaxID=1300345 RepID=A0A0A2WHW1_9GAMM|nr:NERD domain protein [Lysobacter dokdonensis DS-58]